MPKKFVSSLTNAPRLNFEIKRAELSLSNITHAGEFEGYASLFNVVDMGHDMVMRGAFAESLKKRATQAIKLLWQHKATEPIGHWLDIHEDALGLYVRGQLNLRVAKANEALALLRAGSVDGLSIGFKTEKSITDKKTGVRRLYKIDLWEISVVTFPMLPEARVSAVKHVQNHGNGNHVMAQMLKQKLQRAIADISQKG